MWGIVSFEMSAWQMTAPFLVIPEQLDYNSFAEVSVSAKEPSHEALRALEAGFSRFSAWPGSFLSAIIRAVMQTGGNYCGILALSERSISVSDVVPKAIFSTRRLRNLADAESMACIPPQLCLRVCLRQW